MQKFKKFNGQGLVEFALVLPILLLLVIGVLNLGAAFFVKVELENSAREGAYYMAYNLTDGLAKDIATGGCNEVYGMTKKVVRREGQGAGITIPCKDITVTCTGGSCGHGSTVRVAISYDMPMAIDFLLSGPLKLNSDARMLIP